MKCQRCGNPVTKPKRGRTPRYCGGACQQAAWYEAKGRQQAQARYMADRERLLAVAKDRQAQQYAADPEGMKALSRENARQRRADPVKAERDRQRRREREQRK